MLQANKNPNLIAAGSRDVMKEGRNDAGSYVRNVHNILRVPHLGMSSKVGLVVSTTVSKSQL